MGYVKNRLDSPWLDAALHLLDRQVIDVDGLFVCNVDDLEVTESSDDKLSVTGILVGQAALWPRMSGLVGGWLREMWLQLGIQYARRDRPYYIGLDRVDEVASAVTLNQPLQGLLDHQPAVRGRQPHRIGDLLGMEVRSEGGEKLGRVLDVRLVPRAWKSAPRLDLSDLIVGRGGPGSLLGYERGDFTGPWLVREAVIWRHRHTSKLPMDGVGRIDWEDSHLTAHGPLEPLA